MYQTKKKTMEKLKQNCGAVLSLMDGVGSKYSRH